MTVFDYIVVALYFAGTFAIGAYFARGQKSLRDFLLGGRRIPWWGAAASGIATIVSGVSYLGGPGQAFTTNYQWHQARLAAPFGIVILCLLFLPRFHRSGVYSIYDYLERRFGVPTRLAAAGVFVLLKTGYLGVVIYAPALTLAQLFDVSVALMVLVTGLTATAYTHVGGIKAVIWTDAFQLLVLVGGIFAAILVVAQTLPEGLGEIWQTADAAGRLDFFNLSLDFSETYTLWGCLLGGTFMLLSQYGTDQAEMQRFLTTESPRAANVALAVSVLGMAVVGLSLFFVGTALFSFYSAHPDRGGLGVAGNAIFPKFIVEELPAGLTGLVVAGVLAACMSTISSVLNSLATVVLCDIAPRWRRQTTPAADAAELKSARRWTLLFGTLTTGIALFGDNFGNLLDATNRLINLFGGSLVGVFLLGMFNPHARGASGLWGLAAGLIAVLVLELATDVSFMWFGPFAAVVAFGTGSLVAIVRGHRWLRIA